MLEHIKKFHIVLIKPSKYDDDGYVIRFWKGVLPSNTSMFCMASPRTSRRGKFSPGLPIEVTTFDETAEKVPRTKIVRWSQEPGTSF